MNQEEISPRVNGVEPKNDMVHFRSSSQQVHEKVDQQEAAGDVDSIDPFTYRPTLRCLDYVKIVFNTLWLLPLRLFLFIIPSVAVGIIVCLLAVICDLFDPNNPRPLKAWGRFLINSVGAKISRIFLFGFGFNWIRVRGQPAATKEAPILIVAPHSSMFDIFIMMGGYTKLPTFVSKAEARHVPLFGFLVTHTVRTIYVSRESKSSRQSTTEEIRSRALSRGKWPPVLIYPEGTTTNRKVLLKFKKGAFLPKLPVQVVLIKYNNKINTTFASDNGIKLLTCFYLTLCNFHNSLEIEFLPVYNPSGEELDDAKVFADNVCAYASKHLGIPCGRQSIEDLILMRDSRKMGLPFTTGLIAYHKAIEDLGMALSEIKKWLRRFREINTKRTGFTDAEELADYLRVPNDACLQAIVNSASTEDGRLGFKSYLYSVIGRGKQLLQNDQFVQAMFKFFDQDRDGIVKMADITERLHIQSFPPSLSTPTPPRRSGCDVSYQNQGEELIPPEEMNQDQFRSLLELHPEYVVLYHECQNAGISAPSPPSSLDCGDVTNVIFDIVEKRATDSPTLQRRTISVTAEVEA